MRLACKATLTHVQFCDQLRIQNIPNYFYQVRNPFSLCIWFLFLGEVLHSHVSRFHSAISEDTLPLCLPSQWFSQGRNTPHSSSEAGWTIAGKGLLLVAEPAWSRVCRTSEEAPLGNNILVLSALAEPFYPTEHSLKKGKKGKTFSAFSASCHFITCFIEFLCAVFIDTLIASDCILMTILSSVLILRHCTLYHIFLLSSWGYLAI